MDTETFQKFCPVCKLINDANANVCRHCQTPLNEGFASPTTRRVDNSFGFSEELREKITREHLPPDSGISLFALNSGKSIAMCMDREFFLGRSEAGTPLPLIDLTELGAFERGVSRRHAIIKAVEDKYVLIDNNSSNGTWLNGDRLLPNNPHVLPSKSLIQLGRLELVAVYAHPPD